ncbi:MAG: hypothetical protein QXT22_04735 [Candidatus Hadarchaeales archaeon]|uniref:hypothetical protein n=1 Tax=Candidatus Hadarchaeum sp. TaxID=2883567 RepID=UPI00316E9E36
MTGAVETVIDIIQAVFAIGGLVFFQMKFKAVGTLRKLVNGVKVALLVVAILSVATLLYNFGVVDAQTDAVLEETFQWVVLISLLAGLYTMYKVMK